jgi:EAL domain-containing protein (putative c-di-GMP-specific phosphodiesterase class I)
MSNEKIFIRTLLVAMVCVCLDMLSIVAIVYRDAIPPLLLELTCKTYLITLVAVGYSGLDYTHLNVGVTDGKWKRELIVGVIGVIAGISIYMLPIEYYCEGRKVYTYGPSVQATYLFAVLCIVLTFYKLVRYGKMMNKKRARAVWLWMLIWIGACLIQGLNNELLLVGFAISISMMILFFELENPEANMDRETGLFNTHALMEYLKQKQRDRESVCVLSVVIEENPHLERAMPELVRFLGAIPGAKVFKRFDREFLLSFEKREQLEFALKKMQDRFQSGWAADGVNRSVKLYPLYIVLWDSMRAENAEEMLRIFAICKAENENIENHSVIYVTEEMFERNREHDRIAREIQAAMDENRVEVFYQPIYSVKEKCFVSAEALVRIRNRDGSLMPPGQFIPVAEATGSIKRLGEIVFDKTCAFIKKNDLGRYGMHYIEINLSVEQCESTDLADRYIAIMEEHEIDPSWINLEITETGSIRTRKNLLHNMERLIECGVRFSLDDFGSGESNLNYIVDMPVEIVKFDRDMTLAYFENEKAQFVMRAAGNMIHDMGLKIVSEGVETKEQLHAVQQFGVDYVQGFYFSRPLPQDEFVEFVSNWTYDEAEAC